MNCAQKTLPKILILSLSVFVFFAVSANPLFSETKKDADLLLMVDINHDDDESIKVSVPFSVFYMLVDVFPKDTHEAFEKELGLNIKQVLNEFGKMKGMDIIKVEGSENVSVRLEEPVSDEEKNNLNFLKVQIRENGRNGEKIDVCLPVGLIKMAHQIAANVIKQTGLDKEIQAQLPMIIKELKKELKINKAHSHDRPEKDDDNGDDEYDEDDK